MRSKKENRIVPESEDRNAPGIRPKVDLGYQRLEPRQVLSASFLLMGTELAIDGFDPDQDLTFSQENAFINGTLQDAYVFDVSSGDWTGNTAMPFVEVESVSGGTNNRLEIAISAFGNPALAQVSLDGLSSTGSQVQILQNSFQATFESLAVANFQNIDQSININVVGEVTVSNLSVADSNPTDAIFPPADLTIETNGSILVNGNIENLIEGSNNDVILTATGTNSDVNLSSVVSTAGGSITILADDSVTLGSSSTLTTMSTGGVAIVAGLDGQPGDTNDQILMDEGSEIFVDSGTVRLNTSRGGDILVSNISTSATGDAILLDAGGRILDNTTAEDVNLLAGNGRIVWLSNDDIGSSGVSDINIDSMTTRFDTTGLIFISDIDGGLEIDGVSRALGGQIQATNFLTISANVDVGSTTTFIAGNSSTTNDDLTIRNATVTLASDVNASLNFTAGDDIIFSDGKIETAGLGTHVVNLKADAEAGVDADRGSVTNLAGTGKTIETNDLNVTSFDGIGDDEAIRANVDRVSATTLGIGDIRFAETNTIDLVNVVTTDGEISVVAGGDITATNVITGETESPDDNTDNIELTSTGGSIHIQSIESADNLLLDSNAGDILDLPAARIVVGSDAVIKALNEIELANEPNDFFEVVGNVSFTATNIFIGRDGFAAGDAGASNVALGSLTFNADGTAVIVEDSATVLTGHNFATNLYLASPESIKDETSHQLVAEQAQFNASEITIGDQDSDNIQIGRLGLFADIAYLGLDSAVELNGLDPNTTPSQFGEISSEGTFASQALFIDSTSSVVQNVGTLNVNELGIRSDQHVHLASLSAHNQSLAIEAGSSAAMTDTNLNQTLADLSNVTNSEVRNLTQSIAVNHEGQLNIRSVDSPTTADSIAGLTTSQGSILIVASDDIVLEQNVIAQSSVADPQITAYSRAGSNSNPAITFSGGDFQVNGPTNVGLVNAAQTTATFFDANGFVFRGTTELLVLNPDGSADQDIVLEYGHDGETGYRIGIVWDDQNRPGSPVEVINTYVADPNVNTEAYDDFLFQSNLSTLEQIGGNEGGRETVAKVSAYSKDNIIAHSDQPNVFSTVTVRNDQDINLFSGHIDSVENTLNETSQTLEAELDSPKRFAPVTPKTSGINPLEVRTTLDTPPISSSPETSTPFEFSRNVQPFESGELRWVQVAVPIDELEEVAGEVRLKDPTKSYQAADKAEINDFQNDVGENEVEKIVDEIETNEEAEAGYWYKVFKDYENRDDELFFYHYKTGEQETVEPETSEKENAPQQEPPSSDFEPSVDEASPQPSNSQSSEAALDLAPASDSSSTVSASSLILAGMLIRQNVAKNAEDTKADASDQSIDTQPKFSRLDRLRRKIKIALRGD